MKRLNNIRELTHEKNRVKIQELEAEKNIRRNWKELKESISPGTLVSAAVKEVIKEKKEDNEKKEGILKNMLAYGISLLANKIADKASDKFNKLFRK